MASCIISFGFMVSLRFDDILCIVTIRPPPLPDIVPIPFVDRPQFMYTEKGNANLSAIAAKNISIQIIKFCQPAAIVPALRFDAPPSNASITRTFSSNASKTPAKN